MVQRAWVRKRPWGSRGGGFLRGGKCGFVNWVSKGDRRARTGMKMSAKIIDGKALSAALRDKVASDAMTLKQQGKPVRLVALLVGDNASAKLYAESQKKTCAQVGIEYELRTLP